MRRVGWMALMLALPNAPLAAQEAAGMQTAITPDSLPALGTGTQVATEGATTTISGGVRAGNNVFHSFSGFTLAAGDIARWTAADALSVRNVINRITGGERSFIGGTIDASTMPGADFYFINPAGIVIGELASVDVGGMAHFATAHQLGFADGDILVAGTASGSTFSMAEPVRFGFLGNNQPLLVLGQAEFGPDGIPNNSDEPFKGVLAGNLTLSAGDITIASTSFFAQTLGVRAVGQSAASVSTDGLTPAKGLQGRIDLINARLFGGQDGRIALSAGDITFTDRSRISLVARQSAAAAVGIAAGRIELIHGDITVSALDGVDAAAGDIVIDAGEMILRHRGSIVTVSNASGGGSTIRVTADSLLIDGGTLTARGVAAPGRSVGDIVVRAGLLRITDVGLISTSMFDFVGENGGIFASTGTTGNIDIDATRIEIDGTGLILAENAASNGSGPGSITIRADTMWIGLGRVSTGTMSATPAGPITITVKGLLELTGFGGIQSISQGLGDAGAITITAGALRLINLSGGPSITSDTEIPRPQEIGNINDYTGSAGRISITTGSLDIIGPGSEISTSSISFGNAGDIVIRAGRITIAEGGSITSAANVLNLLDETRTFLVQTPGPGRAGTIRIDAGSMLSVTDGIISTATSSFGGAGAVTIRADRIALGSGAQIRSDASDLAPSQAGTISLDGWDITLTDGAQVTTGSANTVAAGGITVTAARSLLITGNGSQIASTNSAGTGGAAGNIIVSAPAITLGPSGLITTSSRTGAAGLIDLLLPSTGLLRLAGGANPATIATSSGPGTGGRITIARPYSLIADGGLIEALGRQRGANVQLATDFFIRSADNINLLLVDGDLVVDSQIGNVSSGIDTPDISFGDAAGVLAGQCRAARSSGSVSRLAITAVGPLALGEGAASDASCR